MNTKDMLVEVDRRAAGKLLEHILPKAMARHKNSKEYGECDCSYCVLKKRATWDIRWVVAPDDYVNDLNYADHEKWEIKRARRESLRKHYRNKLKELYNE